MRTSIFLTITFLSIKIKIQKSLLCVSQFGLCDALFFVGVGGLGVHNFEPAEFRKAEQVAVLFISFFIIKLTDVFTSSPNIRVEMSHYCVLIGIIVVQWCVQVVVKVMYIAI